MRSKSREFTVFMRNIPSIYSLRDIKLNNLTQNRFDALLRTINATFFLSNDFRSDTKLFVILGDNTSIELSGNEIKGLNPDERQIAGVLKDSVQKRNYPGIEFHQWSIEKQGYHPSNTILLESSSEDQLNHENINGIYRIILGGHQGFIEKDLLYLKSIGIRSLSIGEKVYLTSHCVVFIQITIDQLNKKNGSNIT